MIVRAIVALLVAALVATLAVRNAAVQAWSETEPRRAVQVWDHHPEARLSLGIIRIAEAMRDRKTVPADAFADIDDGALRSPLSPEPFLVHGVQASMSGKGVAAEQDFEAAQRRDPRSLSAAYFLADRYFRTGDAAHGLNQIALLSRLAPGGTTSMAPYLAAFAKNPANWPQMKTLFHSEPRLGQAALEVMARDPSNASAILALADAGQRQAKATWVPLLMASLNGQGQYVAARRIWASVSGVTLNPGDLIFDAGFTQSAPTPPFNWDLASSTVGLSERRGGALHVMFYGQDDGMLARQLLLLPPGQYRLTMRVQAGSTHPEALVWTMTCDKGAELSRITLDQAAKGWQFQVPANCPAQWIELDGKSADLPQQSDVNISNLILSRGGSGA